MPLSINITDIDNLTASERRVLSVIAGAQLAGERPSEATVPPYLDIKPAAFVEAARGVGAASAPLAVSSAGTVAATQPGTQHVGQVAPDTVQDQSATDPDDNGEAGVLAAEERKTDDRGIPHDSRVHSNPPSITAKGEWRAKRGVDKDLLKQVESEYLQAVAAAKLAESALTSVPAAAPVHPAAPSGFDLLAAAQAAKDIPPAPPLGASPVPVVTAPPAPPAAPAAPIDPSGMGALLRLVGESVSQGKLTQDQVAAVCAQLGVPHLGALLATPARIPEAFAALAALGVA